MIEIVHMDKYKHVRTGEIVTYMCSESDNVYLYVEHLKKAIVMDHKKFLNEFYNIEQPEFLHDREI